MIRRLLPAAVNLIVFGFAVVVLACLALVLPERFAEFSTSICIFGVVGLLSIPGYLLLSDNNSSEFMAESVDPHSGDVNIVSILLSMTAGSFYTAFIYAAPILVIFPSVTTGAVVLIIMAFMSRRFLMWFTSFIAGQNKSIDKASFAGQILSEGLSLVAFALPIYFTVLFQSLIAFVITFWIVIAIIVIAVLIVMLIEERWNLDTRILDRVKSMLR